MSYLQLLVGVYGDGVGASCLKLDCASITVLHAVYGVPLQDSPARRSDISALLRCASCAQDEYSPESFDFEMLAQLFEVHFSPFNPMNALKKVQTWAILLVMCALMMRISEVTYYCFSVASIQMPQRSEDYINGIPRKLRISMVKWKSKKVLRIFI